MAGKIGNWARGKILKDMSNLTTWTPPSTLDMYLATDTYDADGTGTQVSGSTATTVANNSTVFSQSGTGPLTNSVSAITTAVRNSGGSQTVVSVKFTESGQTSNVMYYGTLTTPVVWPQGQAFTIPAGDLDIDILAS
jgi:hypothetical protein